jgi:hypothetical protein
MTPARVLTEKELSEYLGMYPSMVRRMRLTEGLPCVTIGRRYLYRLEAVNRWFQQREQVSVQRDNEPMVLRQIK